MGQDHSRADPVWLDWDDHTKFIVVRGIKGSGRSWLCDALVADGCACIDVHKFARAGYDPELSRSENEHNTAARYKEFVSQAHNRVVVLISDQLIKSRQPTAKFFIELLGDSLPTAYRRGQAMMLDRVTRHSEEIRHAVRTWPISNVDSAFSQFGFDFRPHNTFAKFADGYHKAESESATLGYQVMPASDIKNTIAKMCR